MANRYWVGGGSSANWNATGNTNWGTATNTRDNASVPTSADAVFFDNSVNGNTPCTISSNANFFSIDFTGWTNTLSMSTQVMQANGGNVTFVSGMTFTPTSASSINMAGSGTLTTGGLLMPSISITTGTTTLGDNLTFLANKTTSVAITVGRVLATNGKTVTGNSAINRVLIRSATLGTGVSITGATATTFNDVDFRDATFTSASNLDLTNSGANLIGDCGGNSITGGGSTLTFTTPATQTATGSSSNWSTATWSGRVPLPQDDVVLSLTAGQTITTDMPRIGKSISLTTAMNLTRGIAVTSYGSLDLTNVSTFTGNFAWTLEGRSTFTLKSNGKTFYKLNVQNPGGTITLQDAVVSNNDTLAIDYGTFSANNFNVQGFQITVGTNAAATINMGSGTWTCNRVTTNNWQAGASSTINSDTSTISLASGTSNGFSGGGKTYYNVTFNHTSGTVAGSNTFTGTMTIAAGKTVTFTSGTTQTVSNFVATGTAGNLITLNTSAAGAATLTAANTIPKNNDYLSITNINVTNGTFFYGGHSTYVSGTGWKQGNSADMFRSLY